jgi:glycosyltransferase involved in cell wall biosynthesis
VRFVEQVGVLILTYNEGPNIERTLSKLGWAQRILIIDSGSTDETIEIAGRHPQVEVIHRPFDDHASQWNFGLSRIGTDWVLSLDADYELSDALVAELRTLVPAEQVAGFQARFVYRVHGRVLRASLYPPRIVLYRKGQARYRNEGHTQRLITDGPVRWLAGPIFHDDRKPLSRWLVSQMQYARLEADHLLTSQPSSLRWTDRVRVMSGPAPMLVFFYTLLVKGCIFDGWPGWLYVLQRTLAELMIAIEVVDRRLRVR